MVLKKYWKIFVFYHIKSALVGWLYFIDYFKPPNVAFSFFIVKKSLCYMIQTKMIKVMDKSVNLLTIHSSNKQTLKCTQVILKCLWLKGNEWATRYSSDKSKKCRYDFASIKQLLSKERTQGSKLKLTFGIWTRRLSMYMFVNIHLNIKTSLSLKEIRKISHLNENKWKTSKEI